MVALSQDVFYAVVLEYADFGTLYRFYHADPHVRQLCHRRIEDRQGVIDQYLTAIDHDDLNLFQRLLKDVESAGGLGSDPNINDRWHHCWFTELLPLVFNTLAPHSSIQQADRGVAPCRIAGWLLYKYRKQVKRLTGLALKEMVDYWPCDFPVNLQPEATPPPSLKGGRDEQLAAYSGYYRCQLLQVQFLTLLREPQFLEPPPRLDGATFIELYENRLKNPTRYRAFRDRLLTTKGHAELVEFMIESTAFDTDYARNGLHSVACAVEGWGLNAATLVSCLFSLAITSGEVQVILELFVESPINEDSQWPVVSLFTAEGRRQLWVCLKPILVRQPSLFSELALRHLGVTPSALDLLNGDEQSGEIEVEPYHDDYYRDTTYGLILQQHDGELTVVGVDRGRGLERLTDDLRIVAQRWQLLIREIGE